jgi:ribosomal-protein-alanine N-acetyltransferase
MIERESGSVVGDLGFKGPPRPDGSIEIGYSVVPGRRRLGYATEGARVLVAWALAQPGVTSVVASCDPDNTASIRTLERLRFTRVGAAAGRLSWLASPES